ncbi:MAG: ATP-dependent RecD-like DNA helicase [Clostridiales bacterium]|jgi:exodeoxyribonuclease V alpha subunit|nr:ATP-dependent RecD-like DNA helicase [Clostridiales bacterium]
METQVTIEGSVEHIIYQNEANGYTVFDLEVTTPGTDDTACVGILYGLNEGEIVKLTGQYINHPTYGKQFSVSVYEKNVPTTAWGIEKYLASGAIKGIGEKLAAKIVGKFGDNTLTVIEEYPEKLTEISGITLKKAKQVSEIFHEQTEMRTVLIFMQQYGLSLAYGIKVYKKYGAGAVEILKRNPYVLADEISGIGFKMADAVAKKMGVRVDSVFRIRSAVKYVLHEAASNGHVYLPKDELLNEAEKILGVDSPLIENNLQAMQIEKEIRQEKDETNAEIIRVYLNFYYFAEVYCARKLKAISINPYRKNEDIETEIKFLEEKNNIEMAENQKSAIYESLENGVFVLTGGPGTGKTTTVNSIIQILKKRGYSVELAAPTGRAAKRLSEATGCEAKTIHRMLGVTFTDDSDMRQTFDKNEDNPLESDVFIIDECSMLDISLMYHLLKAVPDTSKLILVGDVDQLPSVGPGNVLKDIITSGKIKAVVLNEVFRQAAQSAIIMNAHRINSGKYPVLNEKNKDFFFIKRENAADCGLEVMELAAKRLPAYLKTGDIFDIQILSPMRKSEMGVHFLNSKLQQKLNPPHKSKAEKQFRDIVFREGDKVMQIKNNYSLSWNTYNAAGQINGEGVGVFNGDCGVIKKIDSDSETMEVAFDDERRVEYDYSQLDELELSYAVTIHKSQGSEYRAVIIPLLGGPPMLMSRNLLYTAVTRAKELAVIVGTAQTLFKMVDNNREVNRYTTLRNRIEFLWDAGEQIPTFIS